MPSQTHFDCYNVNDCFYLFYFQQESENKISSDFIIRKMKAKQNDKVQEITQLHLAEWPDHGVPDVEDQSSILDAITMLSERIRKDVPVVIHCR